MHFARWLSGARLTLADVDSDVLLRYLAACRPAVLPHQVGGNVFFRSKPRPLMRR